MVVMSGQEPDAAPLQYGIRFTDGSVMHPWNGRTQRVRAEEKLDELRERLPHDGPLLRLVVRHGFSGEWRDVE